LIQRSISQPLYIKALQVAHLKPSCFQETLGDIYGISNTTLIWTFCPSTEQ
jgi:hypothetical protein